jgi:alkaline phosphatase
VTTTRVTHATPAAFYAKSSSRYAEEEIALELLEQPFEVVFGGGASYFLPVAKGGARRDERDLIAEAKQRGWKVSLRGEVLENPKRERWLALLAASHLGFRIDELRRPNEQRDPSLAELTRIALEDLAARGRPFFLMVEGGRIDHAAHSFDAAALIHEVADFDAAVQVAQEFQKRQPSTLVLVTADHATGGLAINDFSRPEELKRRTASLSWLVEQIRNSNAGVELLREHTGYHDFRDELIGAVRSAEESYEAARHLGNALSESDGFTWLPRVNPKNTEGHTGEDVVLFAGGFGAARFSGVLDHTDIPIRLCQLLQWQPPCP